MLKNIQPERLPKNTEELQLKTKTQTEVEGVNKTDSSFNPKFNISQCTRGKFNSSKKDQHWETKEVSWSIFVDGFSKPNIVKETSSDISDWSFDAIFNLKGGISIVGGVISKDQNGKRIVINRSLGWLDADNLPADFDFPAYLKKHFPYTYLWHTTFSSTSKTKSYRVYFLLTSVIDNKTDWKLIMDHVLRLFPEVPNLRKNVPGLSEEKANNNRVFDDCNTRFEQISFFPTILSDRKYDWGKEDGEIFDPVKCLKEIAISANDPSLQEQEKIIKKLSDTSKQTPVAKAFNQCYQTIDDAINKFLPDIYKRHSANRYTYIQGSNEGGLYIFPNRQFAYSHHTSDPVSSENGASPYWLVYIHKGKEKGMNISEFDSWLLKNDDKVKETFCQEILDGIQNDKKVKEASSFVVDELEWDKKHQYILSIPENYNKIIQRDLIEHFYYDEWNDQIYTNYDNNWSLPILKIFRPLIITKIGGDIGELKIHFASKPYGLIDKNNMISHCFLSAVREKKVNPVLNHFKSLTYTETFNHSILGLIKDPIYLLMLMLQIDEFSAQMIYRAMIAANLRTIKPGSSYYTMIVLHGQMGVGKTNFWKACGGKAPDGSYFDNRLDGKGYATATFEKFEGIEFYIQQETTLFTEDQDLKAFKNSSPEAIKSHLSDDDRKYRDKYKVRAEVHKARGIVCGSTNIKHFLKIFDNRRVFPITTCSNPCSFWSEKENKRINLSYTPYGKNELLKDFCEDPEHKALNWMMAHAREDAKNGTPIHLSEEEEIIVHERSKEYMMLDEWVGMLEEAMKDICEICTPKAFDLIPRQYRNDKMNKKDSRRLTSVFESLGFKYDGVRNFYPYGKQRIYVRSTEK